MNMRANIVALVSLAVGAAVDSLGFTWIVGGDGEPSTEISAPTLDVNALPTLNPTQAFDAVTQVAVLNAQMADLQATIDSQQATMQSAAEMAESAIQTVDAVEAQPTDVPTEEVVEEPEPTQVPTEEVAAARTLYRIGTDGSEVTFSLDEDLRGSRITVVGATDQVAGDIVIDFGNPAASQIGTIRINARTLETDNNFRNRAIRGQILRSSEDEFEFIEFVPTALNGLPESVTVGETYTFEIVGDLTITGVSREVTFTTTVTMDSETAISGVATATVLYADWGINIPDVPSVSNITDEVILAIDFVANQAES